MLSIKRSTINQLQKFHDISEEKILEDVRAWKPEEKIEIIEDEEKPNGI